MRLSLDSCAGPGLYFPSSANVVSLYLFYFIWNLHLTTVTAARTTTTTKKFFLTRLAFAYRSSWFAKGSLMGCDDGRGAFSPCDACNLSAKLQLPLWKFHFRNSNCLCCCLHLVYRGSEARYKLVVALPASCMWCVTCILIVF